jgi:hypothetical protein
LLLGFGDELGEFAEVFEFFGGAFPFGATGERQDVDAGTVQQFFLKADFTFSLGELFVGFFSIEGDDVGSEFFEFLREDDAAFCVVLAGQFCGSFGRLLDEIGEADAEFDDALVIVIVERFRDDAALEEQGPEFVAASGVVVANANGGLGWIAADDYQFHAFAEEIR